MSLLILWSNSRRTRRYTHAVAMLGLFTSNLLSQPPGPQVQFAKIKAVAPGVYMPPGRPAAGQLLGVRVAGLGAREDIELRVYGVVNSSAGREPEHNRTVTVATLGSAEIRRQNVAKDGADIFIPLPAQEIQSALELTVALSSKGGAAISIAKLTLDPLTSLQQSPSFLRKALEAGSTLLDRLMNLYDNVRAAPESRSIFMLTLERGRPTSAPVALPIERAQYRGLALSPHGKLVAWVVAKPGQYELWSSSVDKVAPIKITSSAQALLTPFFAGEDRLFYLAGSEMMVAPVRDEKAPRKIELPLRSVSEIDAVWEASDGVACIVVAEHPDAPGVSSAYLVTVLTGGGKATVAPLVSNPYYRAYPMLVEGAPLFFAGWNNGKEGIHYLQPDVSGASVSPVVKVHSPGLLAVAADGSRVAFAGRP